MAALGAGFARFGDHGDKIAKVGVFEHAGEFARRPEFRAGRLDALDALEGVAGGGGWQLIAHGILLPEAAVQMKNELLNPATPTKAQAEYLGVPPEDPYKPEHYR